MRKIRLHCGTSGRIGLTKRLLCTIHQPPSSTQLNQPLKTIIPEESTLSNKSHDVRENIRCDIPRYNEFGIQMISTDLYRQLFKDNPKPKVSPDVIDKCQQELASYNFSSKEAPLPETNLKLPTLAGRTIEEHFYNIGREQSEPYRQLLESFIQSGIPEMPTEWACQTGWTKYSKNGAERIDYPAEDALVFDVEVCCSAGTLPTLATAVGKDAWYGWVSWALIGEADGRVMKQSTTYTAGNLIPLESSSRFRSFNLSQNLLKPKIVAGHNVSYDRARVKEQYWLERTGLRFIDTMSLHICVSGVTSYQKTLLKAGVGEDEWCKLTSLSGLSKVLELYCGEKMSKEEKDIFVTGSLSDVRDNFQSLMNYCAGDSRATYRVLQELFPLFIERFPHPVTLAGMLELQSAYIPVNSNWKKYIEDSQQAYEDLDMEAKNLLSKSANEACCLMHNEKYKKNLWLWDQDWSTRNLSLKKTVKLNSLSTVPSSEESKDEMDKVEIDHQQLKNQFSEQLKKGQHLPARPPKLPGYPAWYGKLCSKPDTPDWVPQPDLVSTGLKIAPKLLQLTWKGYPLHHEKSHGWGYLVPWKTEIDLEDEELLPKDIFKEYCLKNIRNICSCPTDSHSSVDYLCSKNRRKKQNSLLCKKDLGESFGLIKLPHKDGLHLNVGNPLARDFINKFSETELSGSTTYAQRIIEISRMLSYWRNNRERIENQIVCWLQRSDLPPDLQDATDLGVILPQVVVCGTLTRRAVEPTWMTVSNAIVERVGSELRGIVRAPPGYALVGADVDSQELWIASLLGDAYSTRLHGCTPFGWMTLSGKKKDGSDMHSVTAKAVGISRNHAKVINYARIYGAGIRFAERLLKQFNNDMSVSEASLKASKMMALTKGKRVYKLKNNVLSDLKERIHSKGESFELCSIYRREHSELFDRLWVGGSESAMFNCLEDIAHQPRPETPFLKSRLSRALEPSIDGNDQFGSTRINWVVQSGAADFLHLMLANMRWLMGSKPRFCLSFHDEVRYLVPESEKYRTALALHVTNLLTRAFCVSRVGMTDLPQSVAFFSSVEVDVVLRKESTDDNTTPSNPFGLFRGYGVPPGETLDIYEAIEKAKGVVGIKD